MDRIKGKRILLSQKLSSDELFFSNELSELLQSQIRAKINSVSENGRLGPFLNPLSGLGFGPNPNGLGYTIDPNPAHYNSRKKERRSSEFSSQLSTN